MGDVGDTIHVARYVRFHTLAGRAVERLAFAAHRRSPHGQSFVAPSSVEDVGATSRENGVEFLFAQFVDMHGKPNAKLVPAQPARRPDEDGAGFAGFAAGDDRPGAAPSRPRGDAGRGELHAAAVAAERRAARVRRVRRGRAVAVLPAHDPAPPGRARPRARATSSCSAPSWSTSSSACARTATIELADELDTLAQPCYDMRALTRNLDFVSEVARNLTSLGWNNYATDHEDGERAVRAELRLRRRADDLRPGDLLPLHGRVARAGARA